MASMTRITAAVLLSTALGAGCNAVREEVTIFFPTQSSLDITSVVTFTAFEPIIVRPDAEAPEFVSCNDVGVFPPTRIVDPENIATFPNLGEVLRDREPQSYPFESDWSVDFPELEEGDPNNPWGAVMIYIEARGDALAPPDQGGSQISATLLSGCYCVRSFDATHADTALDQAVKAACPLLGGEDGTKPERRVDLQPVAAPEFNLSACTVQSLTAPRNQAVSPGPVVCVDTVRCDDAPLAQNCFKCQQPCDQLDEMQNVPVMFSIDQPGGASEPKMQVVLTDEAGRARGALSVDDCATPVAVTAEIVGRGGTPVRFDINCVDPVTQFSCGGEERLLLGRDAQNMALLPHAGDGKDYVAVLQDDGQKAYLTVVNPTVPGTADLIRAEFDGEVGRAVYGFYYDTAAGQRPVLAVATSLNETLKVYLYEWDGQNLSDPPVVLTEDCAEWLCGSLDPCDPANPSCEMDEECAPGLGRCMMIPRTQTGERTDDHCRQKVDFQTEVSMSSTDVDGDGLADLAVATNSAVPVTTYYSARAGGSGLYVPQGCACARFTQAPSAFELINFSGAPQSAPDLVVGAPGGAFVKYAQDLSDGESVLACGQPCRFGDLVPVRDVAKGYFQCNPRVGSCPSEDVVIVAAKSLGGGSFDDPGTIRIIYGASVNLCSDEEILDVTGSNVELTPRKISEQGEPRDPRTAQVADFNDDGHDDLAVLFGASDEVHIWLGASNRGLGEVEAGIVLSRCELAATQGEKCNPLRDFALPDFDADGKAEVAVVCEQGAEARLRWYAPGTN